jgi:D-psicose/D-tagatose/L-ribulose 3-epimerase
MKLAISNIAWLPDEDREALRLARDCGVTLLEIAPARWWPDPAKATEAEARQFSSRLCADGFSVAGFQAILFGKPELILFGTADTRRACRDYLVHLAQLLAACGGRPLVFGAPKNRLVPPGMSLVEADHITLEFFAELAVQTAGLGVCFCLEPNPAAYGGNYITHVADAVRIVRRVNSPGLRLQIDAGELALQSEPVEQIVAEQIDIIGHVHISQPMLEHFEPPWEGHHTLATALNGAGYAGVVSVEMKRPSNGLQGVRVALEFARQCYATT